MLQGNLCVYGYALTDAKMLILIVDYELGEERVYELKIDEIDVFTPYVKGTHSHLTNFFLTILWPNDQNH